MTNPGGQTTLPSSSGGPPTDTLPGGLPMPPLPAVPPPPPLPGGQANLPLTLAPPPLSFSETITDITPFIPIVLDLHSHNYYHWRHLFEIHLGRCSLFHYITGDAPPSPHDPRWLKDDLAIIQWLYTRISTELFNLVVTDDASARDIWTELRRLFQDNRDARVSALNTEFRTITQGDRPVGVFCQRIKAIGDELRELGEVVADRSLLHALMGGLDDRFAQQATLIPLLRPLPTLAEARSMLQMEEQNRARKAIIPRLFHAAACSTPPPAAAATSSPSPAVQPPPGWRPSPNYKGKNPVYCPPKAGSASSSSSAAPASTTSAPPAAPPAPTSSAWRPAQDPWTGLVQAWPMPWSAPSPYGAPPAYSGGWAPGLRPPTGAPGLLGSRPPPHAYAAYAPLYQAAAAPTAPPMYPYGFPTPSPWEHGTAGASSSTQPSPAPASTSTAPAWDQAAFIAAMNSLTTQDAGNDWIFDSRASCHMSASSASLSALHPSILVPSITLGDGSSVPVTGVGTSFLSPSRSPLLLREVLVAPALIKNLISVRHFTIDNQVSVEFDPYGLSVKDLRTKMELARFDSLGDLYTVHDATTPTPHAMLASITLWHRRLGHPNSTTTTTLLNEFQLPHARDSHDASLCHACQLGQLVRLPFSASTTSSSFPFELVHCDLWTSPTPSVSGFKYYLVVLDDYSHFIWTFPLRAKSDVHSVFVNFQHYVYTHFSLPIRFLQCDNGREFDNTRNRDFFLHHGILLRFSCPYAWP
ncbi:uncharacterized protein [Aegilops tauschii subsp. strangulata]|uniref:uncharacterized protein n=1 Tax=Aegilops tauschii subsp. strangulata TaxID=200361 RepID=UPI00098B830D|nr:uncharacterized protein LOC109753402 [Aegilops tauschii subsp. strangulata]